MKRLDFFYLQEGGIELDICTTLGTRRDDAGYISTSLINKLFDINNSSS